MTTVRVTTFGADLSTEQKSRVADRITGAFAAVEVGDDNELIRSGFSVLFESLGGDDLWVGGKQATQLSIISNTTLTPAMNLYRRLGFSEVPLPSDQEYARGDIAFELMLS